MVGWVLVALGAPFALTNLYAMFSGLFSTKDSSMIPPVGGLLIFIGVQLVTDSLGWALLASAVDVGLIAFAFAMPSLVVDGWSFSRWRRLGTLEAWQEGHCSRLTLFHRSQALLEVPKGETRLHLRIRWEKSSDGSLEMRSFNSERLGRLVPICSGWKVELPKIEHESDEQAASWISGIGFMFDL